MLAEANCRLFGIQHTFIIDIFVVAGWTIIFTTSATLGLRRGIKKLSDINVWVAITLVTFIFIVGPTVFMIDTFTNSLGVISNNFFRMSFYMDPIRKTGFPQDWSIFYWAWWIAHGPFMGLFVAKVSKGRTFKEIIFNLLIWGPLGCAIFFVVFGNTAMYQEINGIFPVLETMKQSGAPTAIIGSITSLPGKYFILVLFVIIGFVYSATTVDSSAYTIASVASRDLRPDQEPFKFNRTFWAIALGAIAIALMNIGGLNVLKTSSLIVAVPLTFIMLITIFSLFSWLKEDKAELTQVTTIKK